MSKKPNIIIRWRWAFTVGAILEVLNTVQHYAKHDVSGWPVASVFVIPLLAFGAVGICILAVASWWGYFYWQRRAL